MDEHAIQTRWLPHRHPSQHSNPKVAPPTPKPKPSSGRHRPLPQVVSLRCIMVFIVYYVSMERKLNSIKPIHECRCICRLQTKRFTSSHILGYIVFMYLTKPPTYLLLFYFPERGRFGHWSAARDSRPARDVTVPIFIFTAANTRKCAEERVGCGITLSAQRR
jgi:hypothetical protein